MKAHHMLQQKQLGSLFTFFVFLCIELKSSQTPKLPMITQPTFQKRFNTYKDMIVYNQELDTAYEHIELIKKENKNLLRSITKLSKKLSKKDFDYNQSLFAEIEATMDDPLANLMKTSSEAWKHDREYRRHNFSELKTITAELQKDLNTLREVETLYLYLIPILKK